MKNCGWIFLSVIMLCVFFTTPAFADGPSAGDEIWTKLANKASSIGLGLRQSGFIIGGLGLIFFSFMAIFNKISWKNLAYIMLSCFVLSFMFALIRWFADANSNPAMNNATFVADAGSNTDVGGGVGKAGGTKPSGK